MANVLDTDKQIAVIGALAEGSSIRSVGRMTGIHRDTILRLGVRIGQGCAKMMDAPAVSPETAVRAAIVQEFKDRAKPN